jgi:ABC-type transport system involved in multi-copper enzyme maturation permease subunit
MIIAVLVTAGIGIFVAAGGASPSCQAVNATGGQSGGCGGPTLTLGPGGEPVTDNFYFVRQPLAGNGSITVRVTSLTSLLPPARSELGTPPSLPGTVPWSKAGIIIGATSLSSPSAYAAMLVTGGNGARMQWNYTGDTPGLPGAVSAASPRWLRLTRDGDTITGADSADGVHWTVVGVVRLAGLASTVQAGLFTASPTTPVSAVNIAGVTQGGGGETASTALFDRLSRTGAWPAGRWTGGYTEGDNAAEAQGIGGYRQAAGRITVTGQGDLAPAIPDQGQPGSSQPTIAIYLIGTFVGLIAVAVVATMFMTGEYRRGLIRTTLAASPRRDRVLAAKALVVGAVAFAAGLLGAAGAVIVGTRLADSRGSQVFPEPWPTELRMIVGTAALVAVVAVLTLAVATIVRRRGHDHLRGDRAPVLPVGGRHPAGRRGRLADAGHPGRRLRPPAGNAAVPAGPGLLRASSGVLPARAVGRLRGALRLGCTGAAGSRVSAAPERRVSLANAWQSPAGLPDALHAEWTKLRTLPGTGWLLLTAAALTIAVSAALDAATTAAACPPGGCQSDPVKLSLTGVQAGQAIVVIIAVLAVSGEYSTGMIRVTLTAMPRRLTVLAAKAAVVAGPVLAVGAVAVLASVLAGRLILPGHGFTQAHGYASLSLGSGPMLRAACGSVLYLALIALLSLGIATAVRESAVAIGLVLGLLYLFPIVTDVVGNQHWQRHLEQVAPMTTGLSIQATVSLSDLPLTPWQGLGVLAAWAAGALIVGALVLRFRDA